MEFIEMLAGNAVVLSLYDIIAILIGVLLLFEVKKSGIWYKISVYGICLVNAFLWGSFALFRVFYSDFAFWAGAFLGLLLPLILYGMKKELINYLFLFWSVLKTLLICMNFFMEHAGEREEERIFLLAAVSSLIVMGLLLVIFFLCRRFWKSRVYIRKINMICSLFYGAFLITGGVHELIYDVTINGSKFLYGESGYMNFYKGILKVDWTEEGVGVIFGGACILLVMAGALGQCLYKSDL